MNVICTKVYKESRVITWTADDKAINESGAENVCSAFNIQYLMDFG